ncbi:MAG: acetyl-CoA carboxylase biotin carboxyl carrier protein [Treponema sp.]|jgi:acetyl-CoA carboxylase biotin carboxyl carrier protein|nr:acetyl-CoA carboxylase biotin carboxyl carrier protein [Treponema sp.]
MDSKLILSLFDKFNEGSAVELAFDDGTFHFTVKKKEAVQQGGIPPRDAERADDAGGVRLDIPAAEDTILKTPDSSGEAITSPIVAAFYASPGPNEPPFVKAGSRVKAGDTLCILEAMKMMNKLEAEFNCEILAVKAESGDMVEYGQPLFEVKRLQK